MEYSDRVPIKKRVSSASALTSPRTASHGLASIDLEVFRHALLSVADEMGTVLRKTSFSSNIKERRDYSCAVYDASGQTLAMGDHMPVHLGAMPMAVSSVLRSMKVRKGDVIIVNDPFSGGTHLPDITAVRGVFLGANSRPDFYVANRAHHADVGGMTPGSMGLATEIYQEGIRIPPVRLVTKNRLDNQLLDLILLNVRTPEERRGDIMAQLMSLDRSSEHLSHIYTVWGAGKVKALSTALLNYSERRLRAAISGIPDGTYTFEDWIDDDGTNRIPLRICASISIRESSAVVDFTGSAPQASGPVNTNLAVATAAVAYVFRCLIPDDVPFTQGLFRPLRIVAPEGTIVNATAPAAMAAGNVETSQRVTDVLLGALARALPDRISAASAGTMTNFTFGGWDPFRKATFAYYETIAGGQGGSSQFPGLSATHSHMTNSWNTPVEAFERLYPVRLDRYQIRTNSYGSGHKRGGNGIIRSFKFLTPADSTVLADRHRRGPYGLFGGTNGKPGAASLVRDGRVTKLPGKTRLQLQPMDVVRLETPGGGGFGNP
jgi:N-methylhydantoinase B/oxoprolinase/acetone carboxylase alpha subunit